MATPNVINAILKRIQSTYFDDKSLVLKSDTMKMIQHKKDFQGNTFNFSVNYSGYAGASHTVAVADAIDVNGGYAEFVVPSVSDYKNGILNGVTTRKVLEGNISTQYVQYVKQEMKLGYGALENRLGQSLFRSGTGSRGQISSGSNVATATITLANPNDARFYSVGDQVVASASDGGALRTGGTGYVTLTNVDTSTGNLTASVAWSTAITAPVAAGDFLYKNGDAQNNGTAVDFFGIRAWCPDATPSATLFCGVDRTPNPEMLAGLRYAGTGTNVETVLIGAEGYAQNRPYSSFENHFVVMSRGDFANLQISKEGSRLVSMNADAYDIGINTFTVGNSRVISDVFCPDGKYFLIGKDAISLHSNKGVMINDIDGNKMQRRNGDTYQFQMLIDAQFIAECPYGLLNGTFPTT